MLICITGVILALLMAVINLQPESVEPVAFKVGIMSVKLF